MFSIAIFVHSLIDPSIAGQRFVQAAHDSTALTERSVRAYHSASLLEEAAESKKVLDVRQMFSYSRSADQPLQKRMQRW